MGVFEFRISFFAPIYLGGSNFVFEFDFWRIIYRVSEFRISIFGFFVENKRLVVFVCVALRAASILKNRIFLYLINVLQVPKHLILVGFEHRECSRTISFEK